MCGFYRTDGWFISQRRVVYIALVGGLYQRGDGADAERERVVAAVAAAERAQEARREAGRVRDDRASSSRAALAGVKPADAKQPPLRPKHPRHRTTGRHLKRTEVTARGNGADAERERVVAAVAAVERAQDARELASRARDDHASSSRAASAGLRPAVAEQPPPRLKPRRHRAPGRHLNHTEATALAPSASEPSPP